jgi:hypothetical protein
MNMTTTDNTPTDSNIIADRTYTLDGMSIRAEAFVLTMTN